MTQPELDLFDDGGLSGPALEAVRRIATAGFHALWRGRTLTLAELVGGESAALTEAADHLQASGRIELADDGHVIAVHGPARRPTRHRIEHEGEAPSIPGVPSTLSGFRRRLRLTPVR